jgi:hypothetical protein
MNIITEILIKFFIATPFLILWSYGAKHINDTYSRNITMFAFFFFSYLGVFIFSTIIGNKIIKSLKG